MRIYWPTTWSLSWLLNGVLWGSASFTSFFCRFHLPPSTFDADDRRGYDTDVNNGFLFVCCLSSRGWKKQHSFSHIYRMTKGLYLHFLSFSGGTLTQQLWEVSMGLIRHEHVFDILWSSPQSSKPDLADTASSSSSLWGKESAVFQPSFAFCAFFAFVFRLVSSCCVLKSLYTRAISGFIYSGYVFETFSNIWTVVSILHFKFLVLYICTV